MASAGASVGAVVVFPSADETGVVFFPVQEQSEQESCDCSSRIRFSCSIDIKKKTHKERKKQ